VAKEEKARQYEEFAKGKLQTRNQGSRKNITSCNLLYPKPKIKPKTISHRKTKFGPR
jgi:hypothetical protein